MSNMNLKQYLKGKYLIQQVVILFIFFIAMLKSASATTLIAESSVKDGFLKNNFNQITWESTEPEGSSIKVEIRGGDTPAPNAFWTGWLEVSNGDLLSYDYRYLQYRTTFSFDTEVPSLQEISISYHNAFSTIYSNTYNTRDEKNVINSISWSENTRDDSEIYVQIRTSPDGNNWTEWCGPDNEGDACDEFSYFTDNTGGELIDTLFRDQVDDQYIQYRAILVSDGNTKPKLQDLNIDYYLNTSISRNIEYNALSPVKDTGKISNFVNINWEDDIPAGSSLVLKIRAGKTETPDETWTDFALVSKGSSLAFLNGNRYFQYQAIFGVDKNTIIPSLKNIDVFVEEKSSLISSKYDSSDASNLLAGVKWTANTPTDTSIQAQIRTSADGETWTPWCGPDDGVEGVCNSDSYFTQSDGSEIVDDLHRDGVDDRWVQYKVFLVSLGGEIPILEDFTTTYVVNATPELQNVTASQDEFGNVNISYEVRDTDASVGTYTPNEITPSFEFWNGAEWATCTSLGLGDIDRKPVLEEGFTTYQATWRADLDFPGHFQNSTAKIRVVVDDGEAANNIARLESLPFTMDTKKPALGSLPILINAKSDPAVLTISATDDLDFEMKISLLPDLADSEWQPYNSLANITITEQPSTVYIQFKDAKGNKTAIQNITTPETPTAVMIQDTTNTLEDPISYRLFIAWKKVVNPPAGFSAYQVYRSFDNEEFSLVETISDREINYFSDEEPAKDQFAYYKIAVTDQDDNFSFYSEVIKARANGTQDAGEGGGGVSLTPPVISGVKATDIYTTQAKITWDTDKFSNSIVSYSDESGDFSGEVGLSTMANNKEGIGSHEIVLTNLKPDTEYFYLVKSVDTTELIATSTAGVDGYSFRTLPGAVISGLATSDITNNGFTLTWNTNIDTDAHLFISKYSDMSSSTEIIITEPNKGHVIYVDKLQTSQRYYFYVKSGDAIDNNSGDYYEVITTNDTTPPGIIFNQDTDLVVLGDSSVEISWITTEQASSTIYYSKDKSFISQKFNTNFNTNHHYKLSNLDLGSTYYFRIEVSDVNNNTSVSDKDGVGFDFQTTDSTDYVAPSIIKVETSLITDEKAFVTWETNETANSSIKYGTTPGNYSGMATSSLYTTKHGLKVSDLSNETIYYYIVVSTDTNGNTTESSEYTFTTLEKLSKASEVKEQIEEKIKEATEESKKGGGGVIIVDKRDKEAPKIEGNILENIGSETAEFTWRTNEDSTGLVEYGIDGKFGDIHGIDLANSRGHTVKLKWLTPETSYNYRLVSSDSSGNIFYSKNRTFATISKAEEIEQELERELTFEEVEDLTDEESEEQDEDTRTEEEVLEIATNKALDLIKSSAQRVSLASLEKNIGNQIGTLKDLADMIPGPILSGEPRVVTTADSATIAWRTDKESNSLVAISKEEMYKPGTAKPYAQVSGNIDEMVTQHVVTLYDLEPNTIYHYQVKSRPEIGPETESNDFTFETKRETLDITNYSVEKVSTETTIFKWLTNIESDSKVRAIPYRNNILSVDEAIEIEDDAYSIIHEMELDSLEAGVIYDIELTSSSLDDKTVSHKIDAFATSKDDLPPLISQVQTDSALSPGKDVRVQTIISWKTNEPSTTRVIYEKGVGSTEEALNQKTKLDTNYTKEHVVVLTKFESGSVYRFRVESTDSGGNTSLSKIYTVLTPRQSESVFQVIMKNMEGMFGWVGNIKR